MHILHPLLIAFLCACASAAPAVEQAAAHNLALAPSLLGAQNACGAPQRAPTADDIFSVADARIAALLPSVANATSDAANASLLWSWSASYPQQASFPVRPDSRCPEGEITYHSPSKPSFSGELSYRYGNSTEAVPLSPHSPNPVPLNFSTGRLADADFGSPFANLSASLRGTISVSYLFSQSAYSYGCSGAGGYTWCGCSQTSQSGARTFTRQLSHSRNFSVETGPVFALWLNPPLSSRLAGDGKGKVAFFARRLPANISFSFAGGQLGFVQPYSFSLRAGECGVLVAEREFSPGGQGIFLNASGPLFPSQLVAKNASYLPFYAEFPWPAQAGRGEFSIAFTDAFSHAENFTRNFSVREPAQPSAPGAAGAAAWGGMRQEAATESATSAAMVARQQSAAFPDFSLLAAAFALPLAVGAAALARRLDWL